MNKPLGSFLNAGAMSARNVDFELMMAIFRRRWPVGIACLGLGLLIAQIAIWLITPLYSSTTQVLLDPRKQQVMENQAVMGGLPLDTASVESEVAVVKSYAIAKRVVEALHLDQVPEFGGGPPTASLWSGILNAFSFTSEPAETPAQAPDAVDPHVLRAINTVRSRMEVRRVGLTYVIEIAFTSANKAMATQITNKIADSYLVDQLEAHLEASRRAADWLSDRLVGLRQRMQSSANAAADFRRDNKIVETNSGGLEKQQLSELNQQLVQAHTAVSEAKARYDQTRSTSAGAANNGGIDAVLRSPVISSLRSQEAEVARNVADLETRYGPRHPTVQTARAQLTDIRGGIQAETQRIVTGLKSEYDIAVKREESLRASLNNATGAQGETDSVTVRLKELDRETESNRLIYESFLQRFKETRENESLESRESRILTPASVPTSPAFPRRGLIFFSAITLSLLTGVAVAMLLEMINSGYCIPEDVERDLNYPVLATIQKMSTPELGGKGSSFSLSEQVVAKPLSRLSEGIRSLRVGVQHSRVDNPPKIVQFTSSVPGEGKSTLANAMAWSAAAAGIRVALVDADIRHPSVSKTMRQEKAKGLTDYLIGEISLDDALLSMAKGKLFFLPAGTKHSHPSDILGSRRMEALLAELERRFDLVIVDSPPVAPVIDAIVVAKMVHSIVYVIEWEKTPREIVKRALGKLDAEHTTVAGVVINKTNARKIGRYSAYYSYNYNKYSNYYSDEAV